MIEGKALRIEKGRIETPEAEKEAEGHEVVDRVLESSEIKELLSLEWTCGQSRLEVDDGHNLSQKHQESTDTDCPAESNCRNQAIECDGIQDSANTRACRSYAECQSPTSLEPVRNDGDCGKEEGTETQSKGDTLGEEELVVL